MKTSNASANNLSTEDDGSVYIEKNCIRNGIRPGEYVRACGAFETGAAVASKYKNFTTVMPLWLESKEQISRENVLKALWTVSRQTPTLQCCLSKRRGKFWLKRIPKLEIDLEITTKDAMEVVHEAYETVFDLYNGPLWKVKLQMSPERAETGKFGAVIIFVILHVVNDGVTNMKIARDFVTTLNALYAGKEVVPVFSPIIDPVDKIARSSASTSYLVLKVFRKVYAAHIRGFNSRASFSGSLPFPKTKMAQTKVLFDNFTESETETITNLCKKEKITVNSFIITVANFALLTIAQSRSKATIGRRKITVLQSINVRRDFEAQYSDVPGFHISLMEDKCRTSLTDIEDFWSTARDSQSDFRFKLETKKVYLKNVPIYHFSSTIYPINYFLTKKGYTNRTAVHYLTTNMGHLKNYLPEPTEEDNTEITYLIRTGTLHFAGVPFSLSFQTLKNKLILSMDYFTNLMKDEIAQEFFSLFYKFSRNMITYNHIHGMKEEHIQNNNQ